MMNIKQIEQDDFQPLQSEGVEKREVYDNPILHLHNDEIDHEIIQFQDSDTPQNNEMEEPNNVQPYQQVQVLEHRESQLPSENINIQRRTVRKFHVAQAMTSLNKNKNKKQTDESVDSLPSPLNGFSNSVWQKKALNILVYILRFVSYMTKANSVTSFKLLKQNSFDLIQDHASDFNYYKQNNLLKYEKPSQTQRIVYRLFQIFVVPIENTRLGKFLHLCLNGKSCLIKPESIFMVVWNVYIILVLTLNIYYVLLRLTFPMKQEYIVDFKEIFFDQIPNYSFITEIFLKFNTCYYQRGNLIIDRYEIARHYLKSSFILDIIVVAPFFVPQQFDLQYFDLVVILKVFQISKLSDNLFDRLELSDLQIAIFDLLKLMHIINDSQNFSYLILLVVHACACFWYLIGIAATDDEDSWILKLSSTNKQFRDGDWSVQYVQIIIIAIKLKFYALYWSTITMTTIGYGDITPQNLRETKFAIGIILVCVGVFAYSINNIGNIFGELSKKNNQFRTDMNSLKKYLRTKGISQDLQVKIRRYFEFIWGDENEERQEEFKYSSLISEQLQNVTRNKLIFVKELVMDINLKIIKTIGFLTENFSEKFLLKLSQYFKEVKYGPEEKIYQAKETSDNLYFLIQGEVQLYVNLQDKTKEVKIIETIRNPHQAFGQYAFFTQLQHHCHAKSTKISHILVLPKKIFQNLLVEFPVDHQKYCEIRENVIYSKRYDLIGLICKACNSSNHQTYQCHMLTGNPNKFKVLYNYKKSIPNDRKEHQRTNEQRRIYSLQEQLNLQETVINYLLSNEDLNENYQELKQHLRQGLEENIALKENVSDILLMKPQQRNSVQQRISIRESFINQNLLIRKLPIKTLFSVMNNRLQQNQLKNDLQKSFQNSEGSQKFKVSSALQQVKQEVIQQFEPVVIKNRDQYQNQFMQRLHKNKNSLVSKNLLRYISYLGYGEVNDELRLKSTEQKGELEKDISVLTIQNQFSNNEQDKHERKISNLPRNSDQGQYIENRFDTIQSNEFVISKKDTLQSNVLHLDLTPNQTTEQLQIHVTPPQLKNLWKAVTNHQQGVKQQLDNVQMDKESDIGSDFEQDRHDMFRGQYKEIFYGFEKQKDYEHYFSDQNSSVIFKFLKILKQKQKNASALLQRGNTIKCLLDQTRKRQRVNQMGTSYAIKRIDIRDSQINR